MGRPRKPDPLKFCKSCGLRMKRKRQPNGDLEAMSSFNRRQFCNLRCYGSTLVRTPVDRQAAHQQARSLFRANSCARCGASERLERHHVDGNPFNNTPGNVEVLCLPCHRAHHAKLIPKSICAVCGGSFTANSHRSRAKICSALCASEWGRMSAKKRWAQEPSNSAVTATP